MPKHQAFFAPSRFELLRRIDPQPQSFGTDRGPGVDQQHASSTCAKQGRWFRVPLRVADPPLAVNMPPKRRPFGDLLQTSSPQAEPSPSLVTGPRRITAGLSLDVRRPSPPTGSLASRRKDRNGLRRQPGDSREDGSSRLPGISRAKTPKWKLPTATIARPPPSARLSHPTQ